MISELVWVGFYNLIVYYGIELGTVTYLIYGLLILCLATSESVIGLTLVMFKFILYGSVNFKKNNLKVKNLGYSSFIY